MKKVILTALIMICLLPAFAQTLGQQKTPQYGAWLKLNQTSGKINGILYKVGDSSFFL